MVAGGCRIAPSVVFSPRTRYTVGYGCTLTGNCYIDCEEFVLGDYCTLHSVTAHGKSVRLGHNCWIGQGAILDGLGGLLIGNNVGIGAYSQIYSHVQFGDVLAGCRHKDAWPVEIGDDAWLLPRVLSSCACIGGSAMVLGGSVLTRNVPDGTTWGGHPAQDLTDKLRSQFRATSPASRTQGFAQLLREYRATGREVDARAFNPVDRTYVPTYSAEETAFIRWMLYEKAKFIPGPK